MCRYFTYTHNLQILYLYTSIANNIYKYTFVNVCVGAIYICIYLFQ